MTSLRAPAEADVDAIVGLVCACDVESFGEPDYDAGALRDEWAEPGIDPAQDARVAVGDDGVVEGYALRAGRDLRAWVHPERRGRGAGTALLAFGEARARAAGESELEQQLPGGTTPARALLEAAGYRTTTQHWRMVCALGPEHATAPAPPPGVTLRDLVPGADDRLAYALIETAFRDVGGHTPRSYETWAAHGVGGSAFDPGLWLVAELDGTPVGAPAGEVREDMGWIAELGVRADARGRSVGSALLREALARFAGRGLARAGLSVRTHNVAGVRVYEALGLRADWNIDVLVKAL